MTRIAFIGLGNMGMPMAKNLLEAGYSLGVFDINESTMASLVQDGAKSFASSAEAVIDADYIISMLPADQHVKDLYLGDNGLIENIMNKPIIIDCSTISPETAREVSGAASATGLSMIDAPVSGGVAGAKAGTLSFMVGGEVAVFENCKSLLLSMGSAPFYVGGAGSGQAAKICNNMLAATLMVGTCEAMSLAVKNSISPSVITEIMLKSSGSNFMLERWNPWPGVDDSAPASHDYDGGFQTALMIKDLGLALDSAKAVNSPTPLGSIVRNLLLINSQLDEEIGRKDFSIINKMFNRT